MHYLARSLLIIFSFLFAITHYAGNYSITLYTIPPRHQIDFSSPRLMVWSAFGNALTMHLSQRKHAMGHVYIELRGNDTSVFVESVKEHLFVSGRKEIMEGYGLGILFKGIEGRIGIGDAVNRDLPWHYHNGDVAFIQANISAENFERVVYYLEEYQRQGYDSIYNGLNKPREGLGAGCTAFGFSFFEVAGIAQPDWEESWAVHLRVPYQLIGGPITGNFVALEEVLTYPEWAGEDEPHKLFKIIDPYLISEWIKKIWDQLIDEPNGRIVAVKRKNAKGLIYDFSDAPVPDEPIFLPPSETLR